MKKTQKKAIAIGAGITALAAAAAGTYFFAGKGGAKNRKKVSTWASKAKKEVMSEVAQMEKMSKQAYNSAVDNVMKNYKSMKNVDSKDVTAMAKEMKGHWDSIAKEVTAMTKKVTKVIPRAKKSIAKKVKVRKAPAKKTSSKRR